MLIGLTGKMGVGKSTAVKALKELYGDKVKIVKFAQPIYDIQEYTYNRISSVYTRSESFIKDRALLQFIGTEWGRETISPSLWIDLWTTEVANLLEQGNIVICDDVRFDNEAEAILVQKGIIIQIRSENTENRIDTRAGLINHKSEQGISLDLISEVVYNNSTETDFIQDMKKVFLRNNAEIK